MATPRTRRKANGVSAIISLRYPAAEVPALDAAASVKGKTRGAFMYDILAREVRLVERQQSRARADRRDGAERRTA